ncbi:MAG: hypothetical protein R3F62_06285 [Planctomycetota bacterium]
MNRLSWATLALALAFAGCSGSSSRRSTSTAAPVSSNSTGTPGSQTGGTTTPQTPHDPGGQVAALGSASPAVLATLTRGAFVAFRELASTGGMELPAHPALAGQAFVVQDNGYVRVLALDPTPRSLREVPLPGAPFSPGIAAGAIDLSQPEAAYVTASGAGGEAVYRFDPRSAASAADVTTYPLDGMTVTWPAGTLDQAGTDVGGQALPLTYTSDALGFGATLFVTSANFDAQFNLNPGTLWAFQQDLQSGTLGAAQVLQTRGFNPTGIQRLETSAGPLLLITDTGPYAGGMGAIDIVDPQTFRTVGWIDLPGEDPVGRVELSPNGRWGYVGSQSEAQVFALDLSGLEALVGAQAPRNLGNRFRGGYALPTSPGGTNLISDVAVSHSGNTLYACNFNTSELYVIDLVQPGLAATVTGFARSGDPQAYEGQLNGIALRPGEPGLDFQGPSLFTLTINLAAQDRTVTDVNVVLDAVSFDRQ